MQQPGDNMDDEKLVAFLDGEADAAATAEIEARLVEDAALGARLARLGAATALLRGAFDAVLDEPIPAHLLALAQGPESAILPFRKKPAPDGFARRRWWLGMAAAASLSAVVVGASVDFLAGGTLPASPPADAGSVSPGWLDTVAGYHTLFISSANGAENTVFDVAPGAAKKSLPSDIRVPDLKAWGMTFEGARRIVLDGKPAFQFFYRPAGGVTPVAATGVKPAGPITVFVTATTRSELAPSFQRRDQVNLIYWRHLGHGYAIVGEADRGSMFSLASDIAYQVSAH